MADIVVKRELESEDGELSLKVKKRKVISDNVGEEGEPECQKILSGFKTSSVLSDYTREKRIFIHGTLADQDAVVIMEKTPFREDDLAEFFSNSTLKLDMKNDIYSTYKLRAPPHLNEIKTTVVCPATEKHLNKYKRQESFLVEETKTDYESITLPFIEKQNTFSLQWVYNILQKKAEVERIVYEDPDSDTGFMLLPDFKWDQKQVDDLYLIAIVHPMNIKSLRDLTAEHIPLLKNIWQKGQAAILERYSLPANKLRVYLHYQPSYYHLHIHFTNLGYDTPGCGVDRAHLLSDVIQNLQSDPDYYKKRTLYFPLRVDDKLFSTFKEAGRV
ncbi:m7 diphosphatase [Solea senegalensis]|uniref:m7GpppX diphosphatase n=1 Tax=Solea senegalensis TaxID=28829 RepID=A0AAV6PFG8_SOLSE|nr:m7GpppX diphosphatase-like [Solea senegalensis]KAG7461508.1 m7 diphosphatase [Solea senegalensis]